MVSGVIIGLIRQKDDITVAHVQGINEERHKTICVNVKDDHQIQIGDHLRWKADHVLWSCKRPDGSVIQDKKLVKLGLAHSSGFMIYA